MAGSQICRGDFWPESREKISTLTEEGEPEAILGRSMSAVNVSFSPRSSIVCAELSS